MLSYPCSSQSELNVYIGGMHHFGGACNNIKTIGQSHIKVKSVVKGKGSPFQYAGENTAYVRWPAVSTREKSAEPMQAASINLLTQTGSLRVN